MRIVGGRLGGRVLRTPAGADTRPTTEKVRQAVFNILGKILGPVEGVGVLDMFAGSGALGIEAISRGAAHATFFDLAKPAILTVRANLRDLAIDDVSTVVPGDAVALAARHAPPAPWGLVFVDPPYRSDLATRGVLALPPQNLAPGAVIVIEHDRRNVPPETLGSLVRTDQRRYGDSLVSFYVPT